MIVEQYEYPQPRRGLTDEEFGTVADNVRKVLDDVVDRLDRDAWAEGMAWYFQAHRFARHVADDFGFDTVRTAWIIALLSPQNRWKQNCEDTITLFETGNCGALGLGVGRSLMVMDGDDPEEVAGGRKVRSFGRNIAHPMTSLDVTLDSHMANVLNLPPRYLERVGIYDTISDVFREKAAKHGVLPHQLQAAIWIAARKETA